jgi:fatty acid desaturase
MRKPKKAVADVASSILSNVAVVGIGLALFEKRWWCLAIALLSAGIAMVIAWRVNHD